MQKLSLALLFTLIFIVSANASILVFSPDGTYAQKSSLAAAATDADAAGKTVIITSPLNAAMSNISSSTIRSWPADRKLKVEYGGSIGNTTRFIVKGPFESRLHKIFMGSGRIVFEKGSVTEVYPEWWGAKGDFNPSTGIGTDSRQALQACIDSLIASVPGISMKFASGGKYYLGSGYTDKKTATQLVFGSVVPINNSTGSGLVDTIIDFNGSAIYQGASGRAVGIFGATNCLFKKPHIVGYTGGTLGPSRERDACLTINYNSKNITIESGYFTNSLGDCIYIGGSLHSGGETGYEPTNININNNILKERYGNGTRSAAGGTRSRLAIAIIDAIGVSISNNVIYGGIDLEPNLNGQHLVNIAICNNSFRSGNVNAQPLIDGIYWNDEPVNSTGGNIIEQSITMTGRPSKPVVINCIFDNNNFEYGIITAGNSYRPESISNNTFTKGKIIIGDTSGTNSSYHFLVNNNSALSSLSGDNAFIKLNGMIYQSTFKNNHVHLNARYCINNNGMNTGDAGGNVFISNTVNNTGTAGIGFDKYYTSQYSGNTNDSELLTFPINGDELIINYRDHVGEKWYLTQTSASKNSVINIINPPSDGKTLIIFSGASSGGTLTLIHSGTLRLRGASNAVLGSGSIITLVSRGGVWFELTRNF